MPGGLDHQARGLHKQRCDTGRDDSVWGQVGEEDTWDQEQDMRLGWWVRAG